MPEPPPSTPADPIETLVADEPRRRRWPLALAALVAAGAVAWLYAGGEEAPALRYQTAEARRGDLTVTVTATGTLEPVTQVEVGTEVSGTIETVLVDYNDRVTRGQVLARLDTDQLEARLRQSEAALAVARARVAEAEATVTETRLRRQRLSALAGRGLASQEERDAAEAAHARAQAALGVARAQVLQAAAQVDADRTLLEKAEIRSPIDGIVLRRQVEPGQTVAASLQTPVLFTLAENLTQMALYAAVDEADVGQVGPGQRATFTVDAFPERSFDATIDTVRYAPQTVEGVVSYETVLTVDNSALLLRPGMTATVEIVARALQDVLLVPNAALRFTPPATAEAGPGGGGTLFGRLFFRPVHRHEPAAGGAPERGGWRQVWALEDGRPVPVRIRVGASDGAYTQVLEGDLAPGTPLVVDAVRAAG